MKITVIAALLTSAVAAVPVAAQDHADWPSSLSIATGSQGAAYFTWGSGLATLIGEELGVSASVEVTGGPVQNVALVETNAMLMGFITTGPAQEAMMGESELMPGVEAENIRALFPMYQTPLQAVTLTRSGITSLEDIAGRRVNFGPASGTGATYWQRYLESIDLNVTPSYSGASDAGGQLGDGLIEVFLFAAGLPTGAMSQIAVEQNALFLSMSEENLSDFLAAVPSMSPFTIPAGTYQGQDTPIETVSMWNFAIAHAEMPETLAYEITKLVLENNDRMMQFHASASETLAEHWDQNNFMPFHPGAIRYFDEIGMTIPDELR